MIVGIVIIVLSVVLTGVVVAFAWVRWKKSIEPDEIGAPAGSSHIAFMHYDDGAVRPWEGLDDLLTVLSNYARRATWLDVVRFHFIVVSPDGLVKLPGYPDKPRRTGCAYTKAFLGVFDRHIFIAVKQFSDGKGGVLPMRNSAFLHEIVQHVWPKILRDDWGFEKNEDGELVHAKYLQRTRVSVESEYARYMKEKRA